MKIFHHDKYQYLGMQSVPSKGLFYAFECKKVNFKPEIVFVREAKLLLPNGKAKFFDEVDLRMLETRKAKTL